MATLYKRGDSWYLNWRFNGKQRRQTLGAIEQRAAEKIRSQKEAELAHGVQIIPRLPTLAAYMADHAEWYAAHRPTTARTFGYEIRPILARFGHRTIDSIRPAELEAFVIDRLKTHSRETVGKEVRRFKAALRKGVEAKLIDANPFQTVTAPRGVRSVAVKFYTLGEVAALAETPRGALWRFLACTGLRRGEAVKVIQSRDVLADGRQTVIRVESEPEGRGRNKSGRWREIPLNAAAESSLMLLGDRIADCHPDTLGDWFAKDAKAAKVGGTLHRLRHTFCAHLAMAGVPLRRVQLLAGHSDYKTTEMYAHLSPEGGADAVKLLGF